MVRSLHSGGGIRVVLFSGGRGSGPLSKLLVADPRLHLTVAINGYDDGASTGEVRRFLDDSLGPSDFRKNASHLAAARGSCPPELLHALETRLPDGVSADRAIDIARRTVALDVRAVERLETFIGAVAASDRPFSFGDCSVGNLVFGGSFLLAGRRFNAAIDDYCRLVNLPEGLIENVTDGANAYLVALGADGALLGSEHEIVDARRQNRIQEIYLIDGPLQDDERRRLTGLAPAEVAAALGGRSAAIRLNTRLERRIAEADLIVYAAGTQHSSLFPSYLTPGLGVAIAANVRAIKLLVTNIQVDAEIASNSAVDLIERAVFYLKEKGTRATPTPCLMTHYLVNDPEVREPDCPYVPLGQIETLEDPRLVRIANYEDGVTGRHDAARVLGPFLRDVQDARRARRVAVLMQEAGSANKVAQSILEMVRADTGALPVELVVFHEGAPFDETFTALLPFKVQSYANERDARAAIEAGGFDYVILFESSGAYRGEDIVGLAVRLMRGRLDAVWGSRRLSIRDVDESYRVRYGRRFWPRAISSAGSHLLSVATLLLYGRYVSDTLSGLRAVRAADALAVGPWLGRRRMNHDLLARLLRRRADLLEEPVQFLSIAGRDPVHTGIWDGLMALAALARGRMRAEAAAHGSMPGSVRPPSAGVGVVGGAAATLGVSLAAALWLLGNWSAYVYAFLFALAALPGLPLGFALFGRRHAGGWIAGALFGYAITAMAFWTVTLLGAASMPAFTLAWAVASGMTWFCCRWTRAPAVHLPLWRRADTAALLLLLLIVPALLTLPFARIGAQDSAGNRQYRAYFTADFVWHTALVAELSKHDRPPRNPYLASAPVHYYWTYLLVPAAITAVEVEDALKVNALGVALLFVAAIYLTAWASVPRKPFIVAAAVALTIVASSAGGLAACIELLRHGQSLAGLRELNIDALASWAFHGLRIDGLRRSMWYNPQHSTACAVGLIALVVAIAAGVRARWSAILLAGLALGAAAIFNPFVGVVFSVVYAVAVLASAIRLQSAVPAVLRHAIAAVVVAGALGWCALNGVFDDAPGVLRVGLFEPARNAPLLTLTLSFGPILIPIAIGLWPMRTTPFSKSFSRLWGASGGMLFSLLLMFFVSLRLDVFWVGFRASQIFQVLAPALVARGLAQTSRFSWRAAAILALVVLAIGLPTTVIDAYNAQDVRNRSMGPGFRWTVVLTPDEQEALRWIRTHTPTTAIVQAEPVVRGRETWSLIPSFAERRMAAGLPISLMRVPAYEEKSEQVRQIFATEDASEAWRAAKALGIDYLYVGAAERHAYPGTEKFVAHPERFAPVFRNAEVSIYAVR